MPSDPFQPCSRDTLEYDAQQPACPLPVGGLKTGRKELAGGDRKGPVQDAGIVAIDIDVDRVVRGIGDEGGIEPEFGDAKRDVVVFGKR